MLSEKLKKKIKENGPIPFRDFMEECLYDSGYGYYTGCCLRIGSKGDFVTSPHTGPLFGALISRQLMEFHRILGQERLSIIEMGAGVGYLARDILTALREEALTNIEYIIVEPNPNTVSIQRETMGAFQDTVRWVKAIGYILPGDHCLISNELLDAFPVHLIRKSGGAFQEIHIDFREGHGFIESSREPSTAELGLYIEELPGDIQEPYTTEVNLGIKAWIHDVARVISRGFVMTIDYGYTRKEYFAPFRSRGTLLAYSEQKVYEDLLAKPGEQDLTAHVNFSDLDRWGKEAGFRTVGYTPQWAFLGGLDFEEVARKSMGGNFEPFSPKLAGIKALILPQGMGSTHKVMVQSKGLETTPALKGFKIKNMSSCL